MPIASHVVIAIGVPDAEAVMVAIVAFALGVRTLVPIVGRRDPIILNRHSGLYAFFIFRSLTFFIPIFSAGMLLIGTIPVWMLLFLCLLLVSILCDAVVRPYQYKSRPHDYPYRQFQ